MEVIFLFCCTLAILQTTNVHSAAIEAPIEIISLDDLSLSEREILRDLEHEALRQKRSEDILGLLKAKFAQGFKSKLHHLASASSHGGDTKSYHDYEHHGPHEEHTFNFWDLQKSIFNTLLQAAKAIKGGLVFIKGHLIKGSGYIISAKGQLISAKGEAITNMGKHIASSAHLSPRPTHHTHHTAPAGPVHEYSPPSSSSVYSVPSGPSEEFHSQHYGPPPTTIQDHRFPLSYEAYKDHLPRGAHHGILILKKMPKGHKDSYKGNDGAHISPETHKPDSDSDEPSVPPYTFLPDLKSIFTSSALKHHEETSSTTSPSSYHHSEHSTHENPHHYYLISSPTPHSQSSTHYGFQSTHERPTPSQYELHSTHFTTANNLRPPATSYGTPIEADDNFSNYYKNAHLSHSSSGPQPTALAPHPYLQMPKLNENYEPLQFPKSHSTQLPTELSSISLQKPSTIRDLDSFPPYSVDLIENFKNHNGFLHTRHNGKYSYAVHEDTDSEASSLYDVILPTPIHPKNPLNAHDRSTSILVHRDILNSYLRALKEHSSHTRSISRRKRPQNNDLIRSLAYALESEDREGTD